MSLLTAVDAGTTYRLIWPAQAVSAVRPDWTVSIVPPEKVEAGFRNGRLVGVRGFPDPLPDLLVMQRVGTPGQLAVLRWAADNGIATVIDFDDAMWCIDRDNAAWRSWNMTNPLKQHWRTCDDAAQIADLVTCTTDALARHYGKKHRRTEVIQNYVPRAATELPRAETNEVTTVGWAGFTKTHPGDCRISKPAVEAAVENGAALRVVADAEGAAIEWEVDPSLIDSIPPQKLGPEYYTALSRLDLMLVGLQDTPFNRAKSTLKVMEAAAMGAFSIAPDNAPHRVLAKEGFPVWLASNPSEWREAAEAFMALSDDERAKVSDNLRAAVRARWTIEGNAERWALAWERAMKRKHG